MKIDLDKTLSLHKVNISPLPPNSKPQTVVPKQDEAQIQDQESYQDIIFNTTEFFILITVVVFFWTGDTLCQIHIRFLPTLNITKSITEAAILMSRRIMTTGFASALPKQE